MRATRRGRWWWIGAPVVALAASAAAAGAGTGSARADTSPTEARQAAQRCASRLSAALVGRGPTDALLASPSPQSQVDAMIADPEFIERFARFLNASFNRAPGTKPAEDAAYWLGKYVLTNDLPYAQLFEGPFDVDQDANGNVAVTTSPNGLGYFRSRPWMVRYAGNEATGLKISTAYRIMNNTVGLQLVATTNAPDVDVSAATRSKDPCNACHYVGWQALDLAARVLSRRQGTGDATTFVPSTDPPQPIADKMVGNDKELISALVESQAFTFNACRLAFKFLYGRPENACESKVFDACMTTFASTGKIQAAVATVAKDPTFCQ